MSLSGTQKYKSTCSYCGVGCGVIIKKEPGGKLRLTGDPDHPVNRGMLCSKGMNLHHTVVDHSDRLHYPQLRRSRNEPRKRVSWEGALQQAASVFKRCISQHGPDSVGFYVSGQCLTEEYYIANKLAKGFIGTNNIDTNSRLCMSSAVSGYKQAVGEDCVPGSYEDIELANCFFIAGANPAWCHPILFRRLEAHKQKHPDVRVIVADPRKTQTCSIADLHLPLKPGTDVVLFHAIARCLIVNGQLDSLFINRHTDGFEDFRDRVMAQTVEGAAYICGLNAADIRQAARWIGDANGFVPMWAMGLNQSADGTAKNGALINLSLITGHIGKPGSGPLSLTGQSNAMGGREVGGMATLLSAHRNLDNPVHRQEVADFWGVPAVPEKPGYTATEMMEALRNGAMKAIWIMCTNPVVSLPNSALVEQALEKAEFVVVQDISEKAETTQYADLLLPAAGYMEKEGTMTNSERRISHVAKVVDPPGEALPDAEILCRFAREMGYEGFDYDNMASIFAEHCRLTKGTHVDITGLNYRYLKENGPTQWPFPEGADEGTSRLFGDHHFYTSNGRARIHTPVENQPDRSEEGEPLVLTSGRIRDQWHTRTRTGKVARLKQHIDRPFIEIHPDDAVRRDITEGDIVTVANPRGEVQVQVALSDQIKRGVVFMPIHWGKVLGDDFSRANNLTSSRIDPTSKQPDFKYASVRVGKFVKPKEKIVVVGAGAAAFQFVSRYRQLNEEDEVAVFSREIHPFYNRVMLPHYISGEMEWEKLEKMDPQEQDDFDINLHKGVSVEAVDPTQKTITDSNGQQHAYDRLILSTGSSANFPGNLPQLPGVFTVRSRNDADAIKKYIDGEGPVVIVGGGLLGLEMAAALLALDVEIIVVQRESRLMERQLDGTASRLLRDHIRDCGVEILFEDEVEHISQLNHQLVAALKSGKFIDCKAMVFAIGTHPNIELAEAAELECQRGVVVDEHLQTSDPHIYAMGEIAEFKGKLNGITAAAEQQADVVAHYISGDLFNHYTGTVPMNILKFPGLDLCSLGLAEVPDGESDYEEIILLDHAHRYYKKCIVYQDRLVGAILMGDKAEFNDFRQLIESGMELSDRRKQLLRSGQAAPVMKGAQVCSCNNVGAGNIREAIEAGCCDFEELCETTGAGTGCGSCKPEIKAILEENLVVA